MTRNPVQVTVDIRRPPEVTVTREAQSEHSFLSNTSRLKESIAVLHNQLLKKRLLEREEFALLGSCLYDYLFTGDNRLAMTRWLRDVPASGLRVVLQFGPDSGELVLYPWEYLHVPGDVLPDRKGFIAAQEELVLSRHFRFSNVILPQQAQPPSEQLRILVGIASPSREELPRFAGEDVPDKDRRIAAVPDISGETQELVRALEQSGADVRQDPALTEAELAKLLGNQKTDFRPHVVHLIAHGAFDEDKGGALALCRQDEKKMVAWTVDSNIADCFSHTPAVVFLHACSSAVSSTQIKGFRGVAMKLVERGVPAVVAMNFEIDAPSAMRFALAFYAALERGEAVDRAVQIGRREIGLVRSGGRHNFSGRAFGCPVAFVQVPGAVIQPTSGENTVKTLSSTQFSSDIPLYCPCTNRVLPNMVRCPSCRQSIQQCPASSPAGPHGVHIWRPNERICFFCGYQISDSDHGVDLVNSRSSGGMSATQAAAGLASPQVAVSSSGSGSGAAQSVASPSTAMLSSDDSTDLSSSPPAGDG